MDSDKRRRRRGVRRAAQLAAAMALGIGLVASGSALALMGGPEIQVNTTTLDDQNSPAIAPAPGGGFTVAWHSRGQDGSERGIFARRFDSAGDPLSGEIPVNTTTAGDQAVPEIARDDSGGFTVAWHSFGQDGDGFGIYARRFDAAGAPLTGEIPVNTTTAGGQVDVDLAPHPGGGFTAVWGSYPPGGGSILARRFDSAGAPLTGEITLNPPTVYIRNRPQIAPDGGGGFTVSWDSFDQDGDGYGVYARRFDAAGTPLGAEVQVNTTTANFQQFSDIARDLSGGFTVVWQSPDTVAGGPFSVGAFGRRFDAAGTPLTGEFPVNSTAPGAQLEPMIEPDPGGGFTATWSSFEQDGDSYGVFVRRFDAAGAPLTGEIPINTTTAGGQSGAEIALDGSGGFTIAWVSGGQDGSGLGIYARRFVEPPPPPLSLRRGPRPPLPPQADRGHPPF